MKKTMKKLIMMILVGSLLIMTCACSKNSGKDASDKQSNAAKGRYVESQIETGKEVKHIDQMLQLNDGTLVVLDKTNGVVAKSKDKGKSWTAKEIPEIQNVFNNQGNELCSMTMDLSGDLYYSYVDWNKAKGGDKNYPEQYMKIDTKGNQTSLALKGLTKNDSMTKTVPATNGKFYTVTKGNVVYELDVKKKSFKLLFEDESPNFSNINICGDQLLAITDDKAYVYDIKSGKTDSGNKVLNQMLASQPARSEKKIAYTKGKEKGTIYIADSTGVYQHVMGGSVKEQLINGKLTTLGNPAKKVTDILQTADKEFLIAYEDGTLCSYKYDPNAYAVPQKQLNVYSLTDNETVRQAISIMQKNNQEVFIKLEIGMSGDDGVTASDAIKKLNTKMLAGEGPDVILLDGMPVNSYIKKGLLMNMSDLMKQIESKGKYFNNLLHSYDKDGVYAVPFRCLIPVMTDKQSSLSSIKDLSTLEAKIKSISDAGTTQTAFGTFTPQQVLKKLYLTSSADWLNQEGSVDQGKIKEYLEAAKKIYELDQKHLTERIISIWKNRPNFKEDEKKRANEMSSLFMKVDNQVFDHLFKESKMIYGNMSSMKDFQMMYSLLQKEKDQGYDLAVGQTSGVFVPNGIVGICKGTKQAELAKQFVSTLLSKEVQQTDIEDGYPVNVDAFDSWCVKPENAEYSMGMGDPNGADCGFDVKWPSEQAFTELKEKIKKINKPCMMDSTVQEAVFSLGKPALTGEKSVEDCVNEIMQKISIYNEE